MKRVLIIMIAAIAVISVGTYIYFSGKEYVIRIPEAEIQSKISENLPFKKRYFLVFEVTLDNARVSLENGSNRIKAGTDIILNIKLGSQEKPLGGSVDASGLLRYDAEHGEFFLENITVDHLSIQGIPEKYLDKSQKVISTALSEYYSTHPVYMLKKGDAKQAAAKMVLKSAIVENRELVVILGI